MYGFQKPTTLDVQYCVFSDVFRHTEGVEEPVSPWAVGDMIRDRLAEILPSWPAPEKISIPALGDASEVLYAELYIFWGLGRLKEWGSYEVYPLSLFDDAGQRSWDRAEHAY